MRIVKDANLALPVYDIELMKQLFAVKAGAKVGNAAAAAAAHRATQRAPHRTPPPTHPPSRTIRADRADHPPPHFGRTPHASLQCKRRPAGPEGRAAGAGATGRAA
jgi:hypothetical protein